MLAFIFSIFFLFFLLQFWCKWGKWCSRNAYVIDYALQLDPQFCGIFISTLAILLLFKKLESSKKLGLVVIISTCSWIVEHLFPCKFRRIPWISIVLQTLSLGSVEIFIKRKKLIIWGLWGDNRHYSNFTQCTYYWNEKRENNKHTHK